MANKKYKYVFPPDTGYIDDRGQTRAGIRGAVSLPPDLTAADANAIIAALGGISEQAQPGEYKAALVSSPCPENSTFDPRTVKFVRRNGSSLSVTIRDRITLQTDARAIRDILNTADFPVNCIQLLGEEFPDIRHELTATPIPAVRGTATVAPASAGKNYFYSQLVVYEPDLALLIGGLERILPTKIRTDLVLNRVPSVPTDFTTEWPFVVGAPLEIEDAPCSTGSRKRTLIPRKYILHRRVENAGRNFTETNEIPVQNSVASLIQGAGQALADVPGTFCIRYKGETDLLFHRSLQ